MLRPRHATASALTFQHAHSRSVVVVVVVVVSWLVTRASVCAHVKRATATLTRARDKSQFK